MRDIRMFYQGFLAKLTGEINYECAYYIKL